LNKMATILTASIAIGHMALLAKITRHSSD
jgi:hypothetical protein